MKYVTPLALVAEETPLGRWAIGRALEDAGFEVRSASSWREASPMLANAEFHLIVVEVTSQRASIVENLRCLRHFHPRTRTVLLVEADDAGEIRAMCGGDALVLSKPIDIHEIGRVARMEPSGAPATAQSVVPAGR